MFIVSGFVEGVWITPWIIFAKVFGPWLHVALTAPFGFPDEDCFHLWLTIAFAGCSDESLLGKPQIPEKKTGRKVIEAIKWSFCPEFSHKKYILLYIYKNIHKCCQWSCRSWACKAERSVCIGPEWTKIVGCSTGMCPGSVCVHLAFEFKHVKA